MQTKFIAEGIYDTKTLLILEEIAWFCKTSEMNLSDLNETQAAQLRASAVNLLETLYSVSNYNNSKQINKDCAIELTETIFYDYSKNEFFYLPKGLED